jgi:hypothetical protein
MSQSTRDLSFCDILRDILRIKQLYNKPLFRLNLTSPYVNEITGEMARDTNGNAITADRLNMRRKAEILKYSSNRMTTQTNNMTKKEKWAQIVNAKGKSSRLLDINRSVCLVGDNPPLPLRLPSSASDVPGSTYLYEDPTVPLYNFTNSIRTYASNIPNQNTFWETTINTNVGMLSGVQHTLFALNINRNIDQPTATMNLIVPLGIHIEGEYTTGLSTITTNIKTATLDIYYNNQPFIRRSINNVYKHMVVDVSKSIKDTSFNVTRYVGDISFQNIELQLSDAYVFEFKLMLILEVTATYNSGSYTPSNKFISYAYANLTDIISQNATNCQVANKQDNVNTLTGPSLFGRLL